MRNGLIIWILIFVGGHATGQIIIPRDTIAEEVESEILSGDTLSDPLLFVIPVPYEYIPAQETPELVADRLSCLEQTIPLQYNNTVHGFINYFTIRNREYTRLMLRRKNLYFPLFEKYLHCTLLKLIFFSTIKN